IWQAGTFGSSVPEQPSLLLVLPSSHCSTPAHLWPSPHTLILHELVHGPLSLFLPPRAPSSSPLTTPSPHPMGVQLAEQVLGGGGLPSQASLCWPPVSWTPSPHTLILQPG